MNESIPRTPDLDDTGHCPVATTCAGCGERRGLAVATASTPLGVLCLTLCSPCADAEHLPSIPAMGHAARAVMDHCDHLDIDLDQMAAAMEEER